MAQRDDISTDNTCKQFFNENDHEANQYFGELKDKAEEILKTLRLPEEWKSKMSKEQVALEEKFLEDLQKKALQEMSEFQEKANTGRTLLRNNPELVKEMFKEFFIPQTQAAEPVKSTQTDKLSQTPFNIKKRSHINRSNENINLNIDDSS